MLCCPTRRPSGRIRPHAPPEPCPRAAEHAAARRGGRLPRPPHHHGDRLCAGRQHRHRRPDPGRPHAGASGGGSADGGGEPARRRRRHRHRRAEAPAGRWLHHHGDGNRCLRRRACRDDRRNALRSGSRLHPYRRGQHPAGRAGGDRALPRADAGGGAGSPAERAARCADLCQFRRRRRAAPAGGDARPGLRHALRARAPTAAARKWCSRS